MLYQQERLEQTAEADPNWKGLIELQRLDRFEQLT
jgi:hypothetical protein